MQFFVRLFFGDTDLNFRVTWRNFTINSEIKSAPKLVNFFTLFRSSCL